MAVVFQFPIDKLPKRPFGYVLRTMDLVDRVAYSFISPETKQQICALPQTPKTHMMVFFSPHSFIRVAIDFNNGVANGINFYFYQHEVLDPKFTDLPIPQFLGIGRGVVRQPSTKLPNTRGFTFKQYIDHISEIFDIKKLGMLDLGMQRDLYPAEPMRKAFNRFPEIISVNVLQTCSEQIAYDFVSKAKHCIIGEAHPFGPKLPLLKILIQNLSEFCMLTHSITLNDLLLINAAEVTVTSNMTYKELNRFLKSWQAGTHPRLRELRVYIRERNQEQPNAKVLFNGIRHEQASEEDKMKFFMYRNHDDVESPRNWMFLVRDIRTKDGSRKATILLCRVQSGLQMIVHE